MREPTGEERIEQASEAIERYKIERLGVWPEEFAASLRYEDALVQHVLGLKQAAP